MKKFLTVFVVIFVLLTLPVLAEKNPDVGSSKMSDADVRFLTEGVDNIPISGVPGPLSVFGDNAAVVIAGKEWKNSAPLVAAAKYGNGRVVAFGHGDYLSANVITKTDGAKRFIQNVIKWLANDRQTIQTVVIDNPKTADYLKSLGVDVMSYKKLRDVEPSVQFQLLVIDASRIAMEDVPRISKFISEGGSLLTASLGWGWLQISGKTNLKTEHTGNVLLAPMGIVWSDGYMEHTAQKDGINVFTVSDVPPRLLNVSEAIKVLGDGEKKSKLSSEETTRVINTITRGIRSIPDNQASTVFRKLNPLVKENIIPSEKNKIRLDSMTSEVLAITLQTELYLKRQRQEGIPKDGIPALAASADFPGDVPQKANVVTKTIQIDTSIPEWHSLGLYAAPGKTVTVSVPKEWISEKGNRLGIRIGCHKDELWGLKEWTRFPEITVEIPIRGEETKIANPFGGLVYITVPSKLNKGIVPVKVSGCVESPLFVLGETTLEDWKKIRNNPAPWGELASERVILSVPSKVLRELDDPDKVMEFWNKVFEVDAELCGRSLIQRNGGRPERITCDRQISAGYMHSGYPVMTHMDVEEFIVTLKDYPDKSWGFFHEFGHNHQDSDWTFNGTGEVTVNLFSLYATEKLYNLPIGATHDACTEKTRNKRRDAYFEKGSNFEQWKSDPFLALTMYIDIQEKFGWEPFKKVFREYLQLPQNERPKNDDEKRDQWMVRLSKTVNKNLAPYFDKWGVPVSQQAKDSVKSLPEWNPYE